MELVSADVRCRISETLFADNAWVGLLLGVRWVCRRRPVPPSTPDIRQLDRKPAMQPAYSTSALCQELLWDKCMELFRLRSSWYEPEVVARTIPSTATATATMETATKDVSPLRRRATTTTTTTINAAGLTTRRSGSPRTGPATRVGAMMPTPPSPSPRTEHLFPQGLSSPLGETGGGGGGSSTMPGIGSPLFRGIGGAGGGGGVHEQRCLDVEQLVMISSKRILVPPGSRHYQNVRNAHAFPVGAGYFLVELRVLEYGSKYLSVGFLPESAVHAITATATATATPHQQQQDRFILGSRGNGWSFTGASIWWDGNRRELAQARAFRTGDRIQLFLDTHAGMASARIVVDGDDYDHPITAITATTTATATTTPFLALNPVPIREPVYLATTIAAASILELESVRRVNQCP